VCAAARQSEAEHRTRDAILLYNIAEEYDTVVSVMNRELGASLFDTPAPSAVADASASGTPGAARLQPEASLAAAEDTAQLARAILDSYEQQNHIVRAITPRKRETCKVLLALKDAVALYAAGEREKTLNVSGSRLLCSVSC
jgi:nuclear pore complex protein Nup93